MKKEPEEIVKAIFSSLNRDKENSIYIIAKKADITWRTAKKYLNLLLWVQSQPTIIAREIDNKKVFRLKS